MLKVWSVLLSLTLSLSSATVQAGTKAQDGQMTALRPGIFQCPPFMWGLVLFDAGCIIATAFLFVNAFPSHLKCPTKEHPIEKKIEGERTCDSNGLCARAITWVCVNATENANATEICWPVSQVSRERIYYDPAIEFVISGSFMGALTLVACYFSVKLYRSIRPGYDSTSAV